MTAFDDRQAAEAMAESLSPEERESVEGLSRSLRLRDAPVALRTNCETGESISPTGALSDGSVDRLERVRREALERRRQSG